MNLGDSSWGKKTKELLKSRGNEKEQTSRMQIAKSQKVFNNTIMGGGEKEAGKCVIKKRPNVCDVSIEKKT